MMMVLRWVGCRFESQSPPPPPPVPFITLSHPPRPPPPPIPSHSCPPPRITLRYVLEYEGVWCMMMMLRWVGCRFESQGHDANEWCLVYV